ncbi:hypothetical protein AB0H73_06425 [Streptomyces olivoreticuli]
MKAIEAAGDALVARTVVADDLEVATLNRLENGQLIAETLAWESGKVRRPNVHVCGLNRRDPVPAKSRHESIVFSYQIMRKGSGND